VTQLAIRAAVTSDAPAILLLADRLPAFGPTTRQAVEIAQRERTALADALSSPSDVSALLVADQPTRGVVGVMLLDTRRDYFTNEAHGYVSILAVARDAEGQGVGRALLKAGEHWARSKHFAKLTLAVFTDNRRAKDFYERQGWRPELETWYKALS
jgi:ribosomal protein S18 acetylase RimI-like enzyme